MKAERKRLKDFMMRKKLESKGLKYFNSNKRQRYSESNNFNIHSHY